ncbi:protein phosphatase 1 regulatory subunit 36-like [Rhopilema esculentum]|uniref:protein phosphatase 1 regulatory subunit 36-like n=1 Tax=Rhopilema esculentum TaxID=499914 RepID=UPI0031D082A0|eukprot:gene2577-771_t
MARYNTESMEEEFPNVLPDPNTLSKRWIWNGLALEAVSTGVSSGEKNAIKLSKGKGSKGVNNVRFPDVQKMTQKMPKSNPTLIGNKMKNATSPRPSTKVNRNDNRSITLHDVKNVAYDLLSDEVTKVPNAFQDCFGTDQLDSFLTTLLYYFEAYFERQNLENKPKPMATEPSAAEKQAMSLVIAKQNAAQKLLASKYCTLILGLGTQDQHHMACGKQRKSNTYKDRSMYETLYTFCSYAVWVCFRRRDLELITQEIGRQFRSETFNPAGRPMETSDFKLASDLTKEDDPDFNLAPYSARHRQKRPAIQSIINQRSPVLVSLLPTSKEVSPWLLDRRKGLLASLGEMREQEDISATVPLKIGIIGESMIGFNAVTLAPFGEDHEEEDVNRRPFSSSMSQEGKDQDALSDQDTVKDQPNDDRLS